MTLIKEENPDFTEETITTYAIKLVDKARKRVKERETLRIKKAIKRGIDLSRKTIVSTEVYKWYLNLTPSEHVAQLGFKRLLWKVDPEYKMKSRTDISGGIIQWNIIRQDHQLSIRRDQTYKPPSLIIRKSAFHNSNFNVIFQDQEIRKSSKNGICSSRKFYGKENRTTHWSENGKDFRGSGNCAKKRKSEEMLQLDPKRQRIW